ncbi:hypothetical protein SCLCIDRAFT_434203 [Scleroderma citrinum Foug A]|uniref:Uncharacterized protein n=1 Tax=Scleroderma citrinum Foug A TaxID=1036808 RepID=A0A0C3DAV1_9AGAM|nr:hypothetical protein SCLCIDRAFT_434203 [Scleroderma citrinum Foug A]
MLCLSIDERMYSQLSNRHGPVPHMPGSGRGLWMVVFHSFVSHSSHNICQPLVNAFGVISHALLCIPSPHVSLYEPKNDIEMVSPCGLYAASGVLLAGISFLAILHIIWTWFT